MQTQNALADLDAIVPPAPANAADDFSELRTKAARPHILAAVPQNLRHKNIVREIRQRMDAADVELHVLTDAQPAVYPADKASRDQRWNQATEEKRAYSQMLDVLKRACGASCCPGDPIEALP